MFTGVHSIGKSASAIKLAKTLPSYLYIPSFAGPVAKRMGFDLNQPHTTEQLIDYQERVLETFVESFKVTHGTDVIYDRSPNDLAAYMVTGIFNSNHNYKHLSAANSFVNRCLEATRTYCDVLVYPEADLNVPIKFKPNRPLGVEYDRVQFDKILDYYTHAVSKTVKVIDIPMEYQYDDRINFILKELKWKPNQNL
jgi:hypothetical protein